MQHHVDAPQASLRAHAAPCTSDEAESLGVLARKLARVRAIPEAERPRDGAAWVRCEELQDEFKAELSNWREWSEDGRCDESVRAVTLLLAAVDAAPCDLEVGRLSPQSTAQTASLCSSNPS